MKSFHLEMIKKKIDFSTILNLLVFFVFVSLSLSLSFVFGILIDVSE